MKHDEYLGFAAIRDDDELLDRLGRRESVGEQSGDHDLSEMFSAWTTEIDLDAAESADRVGPWRLRGEVAAAAAEVRPVRTVRIQGSRAAAVVAALAITLSGGGVAAAIGVGSARSINSFLPPTVASAISADGVASTAAPQQQGWAQAIAATIPQQVAAGKGEQMRAYLQAIKTNAQDPATQQQVDELTAALDAAQQVHPGASATTVPGVTGVSGGPLPTQPASPGATVPVSVPEPAQGTGSGSDQGDSQTPSRRPGESTGSVEPSRPVDTGSPAQPVLPVTPVLPSTGPSAPGASAGEPDSPAPSSGPTPNNPEPSTSTPTREITGSGTRRPSTAGTEPGGSSQSATATTGEPTASLTRGGSSSQRGSTTSTASQAASRSVRRVHLERLAVLAQARHSHAR